MEKYTQSYLENLLIEREALPEKIIIWGTGNTTALYQEGFERLKIEGFHIGGYADNNEEKWGRECFGKYIYTPDEIAKMENILVLITSIRVEVIREVANQLNEMGVKWRHIDDYILKLHRKEVLRCYNLLESKYSRDLYIHLIECRMKGKYPDNMYQDSESYFDVPGFGYTELRETYVDCGAYVGDSVERYIWSQEGIFNKIIAFEPDDKNLKAMEYRVERLKREWNICDDKIEIYPYGVSDEDSINYIQRYNENNGFGKSVSNTGGEGYDECTVISLDSFINEKIDFIKADIESYEYKMILGAKKIISEWKPKIAVCIYHNAVDFYSILLLLHEINPDYHFELRHYTNVLSETVLYAY